MSEIKIIISIINKRYKTVSYSYGKKCEYKTDVGDFVDEIYVDGFF